MVKNVITHFFPDLIFNWEQVIGLKKSNPEYFKYNKTINRNEGSMIQKGQKLWKRPEKNYTRWQYAFSKRAEMFLPEKWPAYFSKSKGYNVWDLDGKKYIDMSIMGIGTNTLGYGRDEIDDVVKEVLNNGNMSTFNCPEEVYLAERLISLHPWSDMVRFANWW